MRLAPVVSQVSPAEEAAELASISMLRTRTTSSSTDPVSSRFHKEAIADGCISSFFSSMGGGSGGDDFFSNMGGGGGARSGPRMRSRGGGMPGMGGSSGMGGMPGGFGGMPGGMGGDSHPGSAPPPPPGEIIKPLALTLEELYKGGSKKLKITRHTRNGAQEEKILEVAYKAGWKKVCRIWSSRKFQADGCIGNQNQVCWRRQ